jgi:hypothetical protein
MGTRKSGRCPNCNHHSGFNALWTARVWPQLDYSVNVTNDELVMLTVWSCLYCDKNHVEIAEFDRVEAGVERQPARTRLVFPVPAPRELPEVVPDVIRSLYREASVAESAGALRGAAGLYRATVEAICRDQNVSGSDLQKMIDALADLGLDEEIVQALHDARLTGNWSLHEGIEFTANEVADLAELVQEAIQILYVQPAERREFKEARAKRRER